jgi:hypothetical protein
METGSSGPPSPPPAPNFTNSGQRYNLGYVEGQYYGIWDRQTFQLAQQFPLTDEGWTSAWRQWQTWEAGVPREGAPSYGAGVTPGARPGGVTFAAILLIILGSITCLFGLLFVIAAVAIGSGGLEDFGGFEGIASAAAGVLAVFALIGLAFGITEIISGAKVLKLNNGWRIVGIVFACIGAAFSLLGVIGGFGSEQEFDFDTGTTISTSEARIGNIVVSLLFLAAYVIVIVLLVRNRKAFVRR